MEIVVSAEGPPSRKKRGRVGQPSILGIYERVGQPPGKLPILDALDRGIAQQPVASDGFYVGRNKGYQQKCW